MPPAKKRSTKRKSTPRKRKTTARKRRTTTTTTTYPKRVVKRTTRRNQTIALTPAETRRIAGVAGGGAAAGAVAGMIKKNKPDFLKAIPDELIPGLVGAAMVLFGKGRQGEMIRNIGTGMIAYSAGNYAENFVSQQQAQASAPVIGGESSGDLYVTGPDYSLPSVNVSPSYASVGDLVYSLQG